MTATEIQTQQHGTETESDSKSVVNRLRTMAAATLLALASILGLTFAGATAAHADTITRSIRVCAPVNSANSYHAQVLAFWYNGTSYVQVSSASLRTGCGTVYLQHNGYYYLETFSYAQLPCQIYRWYSFTGAFIKQNLPTNSYWNMSLPYRDSIPTC